MRSRVDLPNERNDTSGVGSILTDFHHQFPFLPIPQAKLYLQIDGSAGAASCSGAWMFRRHCPKYACNDWVAEAKRLGITLEPKSAGLDVLQGRTTERWDATAPEGGHGSVWYDPELNFIVKILWISKSGVQWVYELQNAKQECQSRTLWEVAEDFRKYTLTLFAHIFSGLRRW